jgi:hypothetical protein
VIYREVFSLRQTPGLRSARHRHIGETMEALYGSDVGEVESEIAEHFEQGTRRRPDVRWRRFA